MSLTGDVGLATPAAVVHSDGDSHSARFTFLMILVTVHK
jgi:hypothetical protein